jgi:hypothetical protein
VSMDEKGGSAKTVADLASVSMDERGASAKSAEVLASCTLYVVFILSTSSSIR